MSEPQTPRPQPPRRVEIKDDGDRTVAEAEVSTAQGPEGTVRASLHATDARVPAGYRASLVDAVMDLPEVQASDRVEAAVPSGDSESLERLRQRTRDSRSRPAGATTLLDAHIPSGSRPAGQDEPATSQDEPAGE